MIICIPVGISVFDMGIFFEDTYYEKPARRERNGQLSN